MRPKVAERATSSDDFASSCAVGAGAEVSVVDRLIEAGLLRCRLAFEQYRLAAELLGQRVCERIAAEVPQERWETGVANEISLALKLSPHQARSLLSTAKTLHRDMPHTLARLHAGDLTPEAVPLVVSGLSHLNARLRQQADHILCGSAQPLSQLGLKQIRDRVRKTAYELDRQATLDRIAKAESDRRVTIRPEPDCMARVSILLPIAKAVGVFAALNRIAERTAGISGEPRTHSQIMADSAYELITGQNACDGVPVLVNLTISAEVLLADKPGTAHLDVGGAMPAEIARHLVGKAASAEIAFVKRLFVAPESGEVVAGEYPSRTVPQKLGAIISARDQYCRTPYCDAPIAHLDHVARHSDGGETSLRNTQGLCAACNYAKEGAGWNATPIKHRTGQHAQRHTVLTKTPSGHSYTSVAPRLYG